MLLPVLLKFHLRRGDLFAYIIIYCKSWNRKLPAVHLSQISSPAYNQGSDFISATCVYCYSTVLVYVVTVVKEFESADSYALWTPTRDYSSVNATSQKDAELSLLFRTRQTDGILFYAASFSRLEHAILEVFTNVLFIYFY